jgi:hypothetical protein
MKLSLLICFCWVAPLLLRAQSPAFVANYDEAEVGTYLYPTAVGLTPTRFG